MPTPWAWEINDVTSGKTPRFFPFHLKQCHLGMIRQVEADFSASKRPGTKSVDVITNPTLHEEWINSGQLQAPLQLSAAAVRENKYTSLRLMA